MRACLALMALMAVALMASPAVGVRRSSSSHELGNGMTFTMEEATGVVTEAEQIDHAPPVAQQTDAFLQQRVQQSLQRRNAQKQAAEDTQLLEQQSEAEIEFVPSDQLSARAENPELIHLANGRSTVGLPVMPAAPPRLPVPAQLPPLQVLTPKPSNPAVVAQTPSAERVLMEQDSEHGAMVEAEVVDVLTTDGSVYHTAPIVQQKAEIQSPELVHSGNGRQMGGLPSMPAAPARLPTPAALPPLAVVTPAARAAVKAVPMMTGLGDRILMEQDSEHASEQSGMVEAEEVAVLTTDNSIYNPQATAASEAHAETVDDHSLIAAASQTTQTSGLGLGVNAGVWAEPTYTVSAAAHEAAQEVARAEADEKAKEPEWVHPMLFQHAEPAPSVGLMHHANGRYNGPLKAMPPAPPRLPQPAELPPLKVLEPKPLNPANPANRNLPRFAQKSDDDDDDDEKDADEKKKSEKKPTEQPAKKSTLHLDSLATALETLNMDSLKQARRAVVAHSDADVVVPIDSDDEEVSPEDKYAYPDAPGLLVPVGTSFTNARTFWPEESHRSPQQVRAINLLDKAYTSPMLRAKQARKHKVAPTGFHCRSSQSHPIQAPVFTSSFAPTPAYTCAVSPFVSGRAWGTCHQQHQTCYLSCQATQKRCDKAFEHCVMAACGTGIRSTLCNKPKHSATDRTKAKANRPVCKAHLLPILHEKYFNKTSYSTCQSHACMCVHTPESERGSAGAAIVLPPSALESWPFYTIEAAAESSESDAEGVFLETASSATLASNQSLYESMDVHDFVPATDRIGPGLTVAVADRPDVLAMSSASHVIGVDYSDAKSGRVKAGLVVAKGANILEHSIPTCARLAGGRQLGIFVSYVGGTTTTASHELLMGVTQQGQGRGVIMTTNLVAVIYKDRIEVHNKWAPSLMRVHESVVGVVTIQIWSSVWEQDLFYRLIDSQIERLNEAKVPVIFRTRDHALEAAANAKNGDLVLLETAASDPYVSAAETLLHAHSTRSAGFWIESVSFVFPARVRLVVKSSSPLSQALQIEVRGWSEAHAHANMTTTLPLDMGAFRAGSVPLVGATHAPEEMFLGQVPISTQVLEVELHDTIDSVFILTDKSAGGDAATAFADQVFTSLGFFFHFNVGTSKMYTNANMWTPGAPTSDSVIPNLYEPLSSELQMASARFVTTSQPERLANLALPGSGVLSLANEGPYSNGVVGVSRSLTPLSTGVDLSAYWGVGVLVRLLTPHAADVRLQIESASVTDYAFHKSQLTRLNKMDCWMHIQLPFSAFMADSGLPLDLVSISKLTLLAPVHGEAGHLTQIEVAAFAILAGPLSPQARQRLAPCSNTDAHTAETLVTFGRVSAAHMRRHNIALIDIDALQPSSAHATVASSSSSTLFLLLASLAAACVAARW